MRTVSITDIEQEPDKIFVIKATEDIAKQLDQLGYSWPDGRRLFEEPIRESTYYFLNERKGDKIVLQGFYDTVEYLEETLNSCVLYVNHNAELVELLTFSTHQTAAPICSISSGLNRCPICKSYGRDMVFQFYCYNEICQNYRK